MIDSETKRKTIMEKVLGASGAVVASQPSFPAHQAPVRREIHGASFETDFEDRNWRSKCKRETD